MPTHRPAISRRFQELRTCIICLAVALALLFTASGPVMSQTGGQTAVAAPDNSNPFSRWFRLPSTAAAPATAQPVQRVRKPRIAKPRKRTKPVASAAQAVSAAEHPVRQTEEQVQGSGWPNAEANLGTGVITPLTVKTVREQLEPDQDILLVSENELSEIDRAAPPTETATVSSAPPASTDGRGAINNEAEQPLVLAKGDTMKAMMQSAWTEPVLLMLAGALAGLAASRLFV